MTQPAGGAGFLRINGHLITREAGSVNAQNMGMTNHDTVIRGQGFAIRTLAVLSTIGATSFRSAVRDATTVQTVPGFECGIL
jgi:hypothetical protein